MTGQSVLIVDDEPQVVTALVKLVESAGHTVVGQASTGEEAVRLNQERSPDVVLLDLQLPGMNGLQAAKRIMATRPAAIIVCTSHIEDGVVDSAAKLGVYAYLVKPFRLSDLVTAVKVAVSRFGETRHLKSQVDALEEMLVSRKWIERAKGIVMSSRHIPEDAAHKFLQQQSQRQGRPLAEVARAIVVADESLSPRIIG